MITIHNRIDPAHSDSSRSLRKYSVAQIQHALELCEQIGVVRAAQATGINYRRLIRLRLATKRSRMTLEQALADIGTAQPMAMPRGRGYVMPQKRFARIAKLRADLLIRVEAAREGYRVAERTGTKLWGCIRLAAERRGLNGNSLCCLVMDGRIPKVWLIN